MLFKSNGFLKQKKLILKVDVVMLKFKKYLWPYSPILKLTVCTIAIV